MANYRPSIEQQCLVCGELFRTYAAWLRRNGHGGLFCSKACQVIGRTKRPKTLIGCQCKHCGKEFHVRLGYGGTHEYCSLSCRSLAVSPKGSKHSNWKGGSSERTHASKRVTRARVKEVGKCERCGATRRLQGHHKLDYAKHPLFRASKENIEVLCRSCHKKEHPQLSNFIEKSSAREIANG